MACSIVHPKSGITYYLHSIPLKKAVGKFYYYFSKEIVNAIELPDELEVKTRPITGGRGCNGMPYVKRKP